LGKNKTQNKGYVKYENKAFAKNEKTVLIDINAATQEELIKIYGIGSDFTTDFKTKRKSWGVCVHGADE
jgi:DNA uptake protein ComE-like DNA-binding protein